LGTVLLDFDADACQSPSRAYLLDVTQPEDHARGLSTFTIMAGLGGCMGYAMGGINWDVTAIGELIYFIFQFKVIDFILFCLISGIMLGGHVKAVFTIITIIFVVCVSATITSFREIPIYLLSDMQDTHPENVRFVISTPVSEYDLKFRSLNRVKKLLWFIRRASPRTEQRACRQRNFR